MARLLLPVPTLSCIIFDFLPGDKAFGPCHPVSFLRSGTSHFMVCSANHDKRYGNGAIRCRYTGGTYQGILRSLTLPLNDVQEGECSAGYIDTVDARRACPLPSSSRSGNPPRRGKAVQHRGRGDPKSPSFRGVRQHPVESPAEAQSSTLSFPFSNQPGDCVVAKSARLRFRLTAKALLAPLLLLFGRDPLRWVRVRNEGCRFAPSE